MSTNNLFDRYNVDPTLFLVPGSDLGFDAPVCPEEEDCKAVFDAVKNQGLLEVVTGLVEVYLSDPMFEPFCDEAVNTAPLLRLLDLSLHQQASDAERSRAMSVRLIAETAKAAASSEGLYAIQQRTELCRPRLHAYLAKTSWTPVGSS